MICSISGANCGSLFLIAPRESEKLERKLTVIFAADVVGYTRLMRDDEESTLARLRAYRQSIDALIKGHHGRVFSEAGDSVLAEFSSAVEAVRCAVETQEELRTRNTELPDAVKLSFRIGINIGDVMVQDTDLFGDGVNVAARLESLAEAGGLCISAGVFEQVRHKTSFRFDDMGPQEVKNIDEPVIAFRWISKADAPTPNSRLKSIGAKKKAKTLVSVAVMAVTVAALVGVLAWWLWNSNAQQTLSGQPVATVVSDKPSIAVMPFSNRSEDPSQEYFADGMTEDLITDLSKIAGLFVIARNSVFTYKGKAVKVQQVARELGVSYILTGNVRRAGDQVRINVELVEGKTGHHLWAERYDGSLADIFALQDSVTAKIVSELAVELTQEEAPSVQAAKAFERAGNNPAIAAARRAIDRDPNDPAGYLGLAEQLIFLGEPEASIPILDRAMSLDPLNPQRYAFAMSLAQLGMNKIGEATATLKEGIKADPENVHLWFLLSAAYGLQGEQTAAIDTVKGLVELKRTLGIPKNFFNGRQFATWGFKRQADVDRIATGLRKAGVGG